MAATPDPNAPATPTDNVIQGIWDAIDAFFKSPFGALAWTLVVIVGAVIVSWILRLLIRRVVVQIVNGVKKNQGAEDTQALSVSPLAAVRLVQRTRTLGSVLSNIVNVTVVIIAVVMIVNRLDSGLIGSLALLTAALGAGLGFGAQNIVKDVFNGLFMVMEDQLGVGDVVDLGSTVPFATGVVERVGIRVTQLRDVNGTLWFVRNGEILRVGNMSQGWARVIVDLAVPYDSDINLAQEQALATATTLAQEPKWRSRIVERPEMWGIESVSDEALVIRVVIKTRTTAKDDVSRELRARLFRDFEAQGIHLPSLEGVVLQGFDSAGSVMGAKPPRTRPVSTQDRSLTKPPPSRKTLPKKSAAESAAEARIAPGTQPATKHPSQFTAPDATRPTTIQPPAPGASRRESRDTAHPDTPDTPPASTEGSDSR
ncbi:mechanosensitive ion channel family protein [Mycetocola spongiae]|uniref:mechanosensitive ion channel family protein n=1 Tax=Mycetocola spongiae TaxID=2859226 RepID=UPI001CF111E8|nr:mechanosensitive ion channel domain-containing protein [Mycetocola spongiae]UCR89308.1 mechanosensitive ion channel family protein [Mycetocola spongiae]